MKVEITKNTFFYKNSKNLEIFLHKPKLVYFMGSISK